nr:MAG TPA: hypothetical protein [Bacteriophage sp.]
MVRVRAPPSPPQKTPDSLMIWAFTFPKVPTVVPTFFKLLFVLLKSVALW